MTNRTDVQNDCIDAYAAKTGVPDGSVTPDVVSEFIQVLADNVPMTDEIVSRSDLLKLINTRAAMGITVKTDGNLPMSLIGTGVTELTPPDSPQPLTGGDYNGYVKIVGFNPIAERGELTVLNSEIIVGADGDGDYQSNHAWVDVSSTEVRNNIGFIFSIERAGELLFSQRPTGTRAFNGADRTNISGGGFLDGLLAGDKISVWVAVAITSEIVIFDTNLGIEMSAPANLTI